MNAIFGNGFDRLLWKEWRSSWAFSVVVLMIGWALLWAVHDPDPSTVIHFEGRVAVIVPGLALIALIGIVATTFAAEHENSTAVMLRSFPIRLRTVVAAKLTVGIGVAVGLFAVLALSARMLSALAWTDLELGRVLLAGVELVAWSMFFSLLLRRPLLALVMSVLAAVAGAGVAAVLAEMTPSPESTVHWIRFFLAVVVLSITVAIAPTWFNGVSLGRPSWIETSSWMSGRSTRLASRCDIVDHGWRSQLGRVVWSQVRSQGWVWTAILVCFAGVCVTSASVRQDGFAMDADTFAVFSTIAATLIGGTAFSHAASERRFFGDRPIEPRWHWLMTLALPGTIALVLAWLSWSISGRSDAILAAAAPLAGFAVGQQISRITASAVTAFGLSLVAGFFTVFWWSLCGALRIPSWVSLWPLVVLCLAATRIDSRRWLYGRSERWEKAIEFVSGVLPFVVMLIGVGVFRATQYPPASNSMVPSAAAEPSDRPDAKVAAFRARSDQARRISQLNRPSDESLKSEVDEIIADLRENRWALPVSDRSPEDVNRYSTLGWMLATSTQAAVEAGQSDRAMRLIVAWIRLEALAQETGGPWALQNGGSPWWTHWAAMPETQPSDIAQVLRLANDELGTVVDISSVLRYRRNWLKSAADGRGDAIDRFDAGTKRLFNFAQWLPWERVRLRRYASLLMDEHRETLQSLSRAIEREKPPTHIDFELTHDMLYSLIGGQVEAYWVLRATQHRRAQFTCMALIYWQKTHGGELPESLTALTEVIPRAMFVDPLQGKPFILLPWEAISQWPPESFVMSRPDSPVNRPDLAERDERFAYLWCPPFLAYEDSSMPSDQPRFTVGENANWSSTALELADPFSNSRWTKTYPAGEHFAAALHGYVVPRVDPSSEDDDESLK